MKKGYTKTLVALGLSLLSFSEASAQLTNDDYSKALWMTTRFYGGQRSSDANNSEPQHNWLIQDYLPSGVDQSKEGVAFLNDSDGSYDLSGGWFDCGDHVFFGQTGFYAAYALLKSYDAFPEGYDDFYDANYAGYRSAGDYSWEGGKGAPNNIPDVLDEVKHATDFFIKAARNSSTFYYEKGNGDADHKKRITAVLMQTEDINNGGEPREMNGNPNGGSMASMCGAALALMSRVYRPFDATYADLCLVHAEYAYDYAKAHPGSVGAATGSFYSANDNWMNGYAMLLGELYLATNDNSYKTEALNLDTDPGNGGDVHPNAGYTFDYSNTGELALYVLAEVGHPDAKSDFNTRINAEFLANGEYNNEGIYTGGGSWGKLRYVGNAGYLIALYDKINGNSLNNKVYSNVDYILGDNSGNQSFIGGYSPDGINNVDYPTQIHHRNAYLYEGNSNSEYVDYPTKNIQNGALVGGTLTGAYNNEWDDYVNTEVCVDYNVGITGALAAINAVKNPVDPNDFLEQCSSPDLGDDLSLCGVGSATLSSGLSTANYRTFEWFKDGVSQNASTRELTVSEGGVWKVIVDSAGVCTRSSSVEISASLPDLDLGEDSDLCSPSEVTLEAGVSGSGISYLWKKDNSTLSTETTSSLLVSEAGTYELTISASGCTAKRDEVVFTSSLPEVMGGEYCTEHNASAVLEVVNGTGEYEWYSVATGGSSLGSGDIFEVLPTVNTTYYVEDVSAFEVNVGPASNSGGTTEGAERSQMQFIAYENFTLETIDVIKGNYGGDNNEDWIIEIYSDNNGTLGTLEYTGVTTSIQKSDGDIQTIPVDVDVEGSEAGTTYWLSIKQGAVLKYLNNFDYSTPYSASSGGAVIMEITQGRHDNNNSSTAGMAFNWKISAGQDCDRVAVEAVEACAVGTEELEEIQLVNVFPNPSANSAVVKSRTSETSEVMILDMKGQIVEEFTLNGRTEFGSNLPSGVYIIQVKEGNQFQNMKFVKE